MLAEADVFASLGLTRRDALWAAAALTADKPLPLFAGDIDGEGIVEPAAHLPRMTEGEHVVEDYVALRLTLRAHPMAFLRHKLTPGTPPLAQVDGAPHGKRLSDATCLIRSDVWGKLGERRESRRS